MVLVGRFTFSSGHMRVQTPSSRFAKGYFNQELSSELFDLPCEIFSIHHTDADRALFCIHVPTSFLNGTPFLVQNNDQKVLRKVALHRSSPCFVDGM